MVYTTARLLQAQDSSQPGTVYLCSTVLQLLHRDQCSTAVPYGTIGPQHHWRHWVCGIFA